MVNIGEAGGGQTSRRYTAISAENQTPHAPNEVRNSEGDTLSTAGGLGSVVSSQTRPKIIWQIFLASFDEMVSQRASALNFFLHALHHKFLI